MSCDIEQAAGAAKTIIWNEDHADSFIVMHVVVDPVFMSVAHDFKVLGSFSLTEVDSTCCCDFKFNICMQSVAESAFFHVAASNIVESRSASSERVTEYYRHAMKDDS
jgi:hypothetical protein